MVSATQNLDNFTPSRGHTYLPPMLKSAEKPHTGLSQKSKEPTPVPSSQGETTTQTPATNGQSSSVTSTQTLIEAIRMTMQYSEEYMDESPLIGEPGNFRVSKPRDALVPATASSQNARATTASKTGSPAPVEPPSPLPSSQQEML